MSLTLSTADHGRLIAALDVLLAPLRFPTREAWYRAAGECLESLFDGDATLVVTAEPGNVAHTSAAAPELAAGFARHAKVEAGALRSDIGALDRSLAHCRPFTSGSFTSTTWDRLSGAGFLRSAYYNDVVVPLGVRSCLGWFRSATSSFACLGVHSGRAEPEPVRFGEDTGALLDLLRPAFEAGFDMAGWMDGCRAGLQAAFDGHSDGVLVWDPHRGRELYRNRALREAPVGDPGIGSLAGAMVRFARRFSFSMSTLPGPEIRIGSARYRLSVGKLPAGILSQDEALIVSARRLDTPLPSARQLSAAWGLTRRESEIAVALAYGESDAAIARSFGLSPHTVRHHAERIFAKLGIHSRKSIGLRLLEAARRPELHRG